MLEKELKEEIEVLREQLNELRLSFRVNMMRNSQYYSHKEFDDFIDGLMEQCRKRVKKKDS